MRPFMVLFAPQQRCSVALAHSVRVTVASYVPQISLPAGSRIRVSIGPLVKRTAVAGCRPCPRGPPDGSPEVRHGKGYELRHLVTEQRDVRLERHTPAFPGLRRQYDVHPPIERRKGAAVCHCQDEQKQDVASARKSARMARIRIVGAGLAIFVATIAMARATGPGPHRPDPLSCILVVLSAFAVLSYWYWQCTKNCDGDSFCKDRCRWFFIVISVALIFFELYCFLEGTHGMPV